MDEATRRELVERAQAVRGKAYAPYSGFKVGAALAGESGRFFTGCNVENASYGLTLCAERSALAAAVAAGELRLTALVVASEGGVSPCGACRQAIAELAPEIEVVLIDVATGAASETTLRELLPRPFGLGGGPAKA